jgi:murein L,D-transpeptidase YcbB/YkuD
MAMKVVVGDPDHPTPVIQTSMVGVTFNPPWNIPSSIVTKEIMPKVKKDPAYLKKNDMAYIQGHGLVQLPGPKNPLGQIKFETPNRFDVYLHDTPSKKTFERVARAQSHGCVRVEKAHDLADFVLRQLAWQPEQVEAAVAANETQRVELKHRWRVHLMYWTSFVDADGTVEFRDDVYGRDKRLHEALAALPKGAPAVAATKNAIKVGLNER